MCQPVVMPQIPLDHATRTEEQSGDCTEGCGWSQRSHREGCGDGQLSQLINELSLTLNARSSGLPLGSDEAPVTSGDATWGPWLPKSEAVTGDL